MYHVFVFFLAQGHFQGKKVLSPNKTNIIQDQPSSNVQKQPSRGVVKKRKGLFFKCLEVIKIA